MDTFPAHPMDPVTENLQIPFRRRPRKILVVSSFGSEDCVATENLQSFVQKTFKNAVNVNGQEIVELQENARESRFLAGQVGLGYSESCVGVNWEVEKYYPATERVSVRTKRTKCEVVVSHQDISVVEKTELQKQEERQRADLDIRPSADERPKPDDSLQLILDHSDSALETSVKPVVPTDGSESNILDRTRDKTLTTDSLLALDSGVYDDTHSHFYESLTDKSIISSSDVLKDSSIEADFRSVSLTILTTTLKSAGLEFIVQFESFVQHRGTAVVLSVKITRKRLRPD